MSRPFRRPSQSENRSVGRRDILGREPPGVNSEARRRLRDGDFGDRDFRRIQTMRTQRRRPTCTTAPGDASTGTRRRRRHDRTVDPHPALGDQPCPLACRRGQARNDAAACDSAHRRSAARRSASTNSGMSLGSSWSLVHPVELGLGRGTGAGAVVQVAHRRGHPALRRVGVRACRRPRPATQLRRSRAGTSRWRAAA